MRAGNATNKLTNYILNSMNNKLINGALLCNSGKLCNCFNQDIHSFIH